MYKVFINEKPVILTDQVPDKNDQKEVLLYNFTNQPDLMRVITWFDQNELTRELIVINTKNFNLLHDAFISLFANVVAAGGIVFHPEKGMLWILRHNRWDLPKGKTKSKENLEDAAIREVAEETGISGITITGSLGVSRHVYYEKNRFILKTSHWFKMEVANPYSQLVPQVNEGITHVEWADRTTINEKIGNTYASLQELAKGFVRKYTNWEVR